MKILLIDNYDSFVYNIVGLLQKCSRIFPDLAWDVKRNDSVIASDTDSYDGIILSPGPGLPSEAGRLLDIIRYAAGRRPILGICLGCQAIAEHYGAKLRQLKSPRHGHCSQLNIIDDKDPVMGFLKKTHENNKHGMVGRYHSWVIDDESIPPTTPLCITSHDEEGHIMSIRHTELPIFGLQFHPESIISTDGPRILSNFLRILTVDSLK